MTYSLHKGSAWADRIGQSQRLYAFIAASIMILGWQCAYDVTKFPWDAGGYWASSNLKMIFHAPKDMRGYFYPLLLSPLSSLSDHLSSLGMMPYRVVSSVVYGFALTCLVPAAFVGLCGGTLSFARRMIVPFLVMLLFPGVVIYPLSDLPALLMVVGAIYLLLLSKNQMSGARSTVLYLGAGFLMAGAYNTRPVYLFPLTILAASISVFLLYKQPFISRIFAMLAILLGVTLPSAPQTYINAVSHDRIYPGVIAEVRGMPLSTSQLLWGIAIQRYETSINSNDPSPSTFYFDKAGENLFEANDISARSFTIGGYLDIVLSHPITFLGIYGRHFINGLDLRDGEVYTRQSSPAKNAEALTNFLVLFIAVVIVAFALRNRQHGTKPRTLRLTAENAFNLSCIAVIFLPVVLAIPGAIETRFFLAIHVACYCAIAFLFDEATWAAHLKRRWLPIGFLFMSSILAFFAITTETMANQHYRWPTVLG